MLEGDSESVGRRAGESGRRDELSEGARRRAHGGKYGHRLVDDSDAARLVHVLILVSHDVRRKFSLTYGVQRKRAARVPLEQPRVEE